MLNRFELKTCWSRIGAFGGPHPSDVAFQLKRRGGGGTPRRFESASVPLSWENPHHVTVWRATRQCSLGRGVPPRDVGKHATTLFSSGNEGVWHQ